MAASLAMVPTRGGTVEQTGKGAKSQKGESLKQLACNSGHVPSLPESPAVGKRNMELPSYGSTLIFLL